MANGLSGAESKERHKSYGEFVDALKILCLDLAKQIVKDGEGATKFIEIKVMGAENKNQAKEVALKIANSPLFKTMCYGSNPNFGRVAAACGSVRDSVNTERVDIYLNNVIAVKKGIAVSGRLPANIFNKKDISIRVELHSGSAGARIFTSDLSPEYVKINAAYS
jgi:glutamate N-acetyltransferase / amino-acid N-acetyltransferase